MKWLLDTDVLSLTRRPHLADPAVVRWLDQQHPYTLHISAITVFELELGATMKERVDPVQGARLRQWIDTVLMTFADRILPMDHEVASIAAGYQVPDRRPLHDSLIAATAELSNLAVVTRNRRDFASFGVPLFNPWESSA